MTNTQAAEIIYEKLKAFMCTHSWPDAKVPEQARALFTAVCFVGDIEADTAPCDTMLRELYGGENIYVSFDTFESYMCELIV